MTITVNTIAYNQDSALNDGNTVVYTAPAHSYQSKMLLTLKRTAPKKTPTFPGVARSEQKFTESQTIGTDTLDAIISANTSLPVGMTEAAFDTLAAKFAAYVASATFKAVAWKHDLTA